MANWLEPMTQTFEFYIVDPMTWKDKSKLDNVKKCSINRDSDAETLGSATIDIAESVGECYIRVYMITIQNGLKEKHPLGTFLVQTPSSSFDGKIREVSMDAYTPLLELKESPPPIGYSIRKNENIMKTVYSIIRDKKILRAPVIEAASDEKLLQNFIAETDDTWLSFLTDLIANAKYEFGIDELGQIIFLPKQDITSLQPIWTYNDDNSSILYPQITMDHDLYGIPNVIDISFRNGTKSFHTRIVNDDPNSPVSTVNRGREIVYRPTENQIKDYFILNPANEKMFDEYAKQLLRSLSTIEYKITYTHGYCPVRVGDCVRLNYVRSGITNVKAKVISQSIECEEGCPVSETAVYTTKLWG